LRFADLFAVPNQVDVKRIRFAFGNERLKLKEGLVSMFGRKHAQAIEYAVNVCVDRANLTPQSKHQDTGGGFESHTFETLQIVHGVSSVHLAKLGE
jgi:hypothetical protein